MFMFFVAVARTETPRYWSQTIVVERASTDAPHEVDLVHVDQKDSLVGGLNVTNRSSEPGASGTVMVIDGHENADGTFWPSAELYVQKDKNNEWIKVGTSGDENPIKELRIYSNTSVIGLRVNLDPFKTHLGKFKFGRIVLKSGDEAVFILDDLKPPRTEKDR
jgi:hypothetical protein